MPGDSQSLTFTAAGTLEAFRDQPSCLVVSGVELLIFDGEKAPLRRQPS